MQILRTLIAGAVAAAPTVSRPPALSERLTLRPFDTLRVALSHVEGRQTQAARRVEGRRNRSELVMVKSVTDGDTITVTTLGRVRLLGIDAPEMSHGLDTSEPFGSEARDRLMRLVWHRWIRLETEGPTFDAYNRRLAYVVTEDGQCINTVLVREGLARVSAREPLTRLDELRRAEAEAQRFRRGMWGSAPPIPPTRYTRPAGATRSSAPKHPQPTKGARKKKRP